MDSKKYVNDYVIVEDYDPVRKKLITRAVYNGRYFGFVHADNIKKIKTLYLSLSAVIFLSYVLILFINAPCSHNWYTMVPLAVMMLPLIFMGASALRLIRAGEKMTREHRDKVTNRYRVVTLASLILSGAALIGHVVYSILVHDTGRDILYYVLTVLIFTSSFFLFKKRDLLSTEELPEEKSAVPVEEEGSGPEEG